jgi:hypothetical protein
VTVSAAHCQTDPEYDPDPFDIVAVGDRCFLTGFSRNGLWSANTRGTCTLNFADGPHTMRITDATVRFGPYRGDVRIGGDDVQSGAHMLYTFSGDTAEGVGPAVSHCDEQRRLRAAAIAQSAAAASESPLGKSDWQH